MQQQDTTKGEEDKFIQDMDIMDKRLKDLHVVEKDISDKESDMSSIAPAPSRSIAFAQNNRDTTTKSETKEDDAVTIKGYPKLRGTLRTNQYQYQQRTTQKQRPIQKQILATSSNMDTHTSTIAPGYTAIPKEPESSIPHYTKYSSSSFHNYIPEPDPYTLQQQQQQPLYNLAGPDTKTSIQYNPYDIFGGTSTSNIQTDRTGTNNNPNKSRPSVPNIETGNIKTLNANPLTGSNTNIPQRPLGPPTPAPPMFNIKQFETENELKSKYITPTHRDTQYRGKTETLHTGQPTAPYIDDRTPAHTRHIPLYTTPLHKSPYLNTTTPVMYQNKNPIQYHQKHSDFNIHHTKSQINPQIPATTHFNAPRSAITPINSNTTNNILQHQYQIQ